MPVTSQLDEDGLEETHAAIIISKRVTRQSTFYQVVWLGKPETESSWEEVSSLPKQLVSNYEEGMVVEIQKETSVAGGHALHTLSTTSSPSQAASVVEPACKRPRTSFTEANSETSGTFVMSEEEKAAMALLKCNTEKEAHGRLNYRTAGILAGIWPCGTITMVAELFGAESKSQVYGHLHCFFNDNQKSTSTIKTLCYDDGCHLKKYATNPSRSAMTPVATQLASLQIVVDRMHFKGHTDPWCHEHCDPNKVKDLHKVDTEICEQTFAWLSRYAKITRWMNRERFLFYILFVCDNRNRRLTNI